MVWENSIESIRFDLGKVLSKESPVTNQGGFLVNKRISDPRNSGTSLLILVVVQDFASLKEGIRGILMQVRDSNSSSWHLILQGKKQKQTNVWTNYS